MASHPRFSSGGHRSVHSGSPNHMRRTTVITDTGTMDLPERFQNDDDEDEDDGTGIGDEDHAAVFTQRSMYGILAATHSRPTFPSSFQQDSGSESESGAPRSPIQETRVGDKGREQSSSHNPSRSNQSGQPVPRPGASRHRPNTSTSDHKLSKSLFRPSRRYADLQGHDPLSQSQILPDRGGEGLRARRRSSPLNIRRDVPVLDQKLQAMAKAGMVSASGSPLQSPGADTVDPAADPTSRESRSLPEAVARIFQFPEPEEVIAEYPCWYLQNVLLDGFMYITPHHICFYAYLQKKANIVIKRGYLERLPKHGLRYRRYWFVLKGDTFSYHERQSDIYSPLNQVDLRYAISADLTPPVEPGKEPTEFTITTPNRIYNYRADNPDAAKEWVKQLQKVIFRSNNDSDSVKISIPNSNVLDWERSTVVEGVDTIMLRVMDNDETFAIDEYFFTFLKSGEEALAVLGRLIEPGNAQGEQSVGDRERTSRSPSAIRESTDSIATTSELAPSSISTGEDVDVDMSASQMLVDEGVFRRPTLHEAPRTSLIPGLDRLRQNFGQPARQSETDAAPELSTSSSIDRTSGTYRPELERKHSGGSSRTVEQGDYRRNSADASAGGRGLRTLAVPIQQAINLASVVRSQGKRMSSYLSSSPKTYIDRWSDAIAGGKRQYLEVEGLAPDDSVRDPEHELDIIEHQRRFREHFGLLSSENLVSTYFCWIHKTVPLYGKVYIGTRNFCFRSLIYGTKTKIVLPFKEIDTVHKQRGFRWGAAGMVLVIKGHEELFFDFTSTGLRDDCAVTVFQSIEAKSNLVESVILTKEEQRNAEDAANENELLRTVRQEGNTGQYDQILLSGSVRFDDPSASILDFTPKEPLRIVCLTIGSRGDVQPYIALCKGLLARGHKPTIATHSEFAPWVKQHGIGFAEVAGDPAELIRICVEHGMFTPSFMLETTSKFRPWLDGLLSSAYEACKGADLIIESPSAMCGIHIAEALEVPYFRAFTMPWTRTRAYPHAFAVLNRKLGGGYNHMTYTFFDNLFWRTIAGQINRWRGRSLGLAPTSLDKMQQNKVPFLYNFSPSVVSPPLDFSEWIKVTGYWFLDEGRDYVPAPDLAAFIKKARDDNQKLVYIGFGSITVADSRQLTQQIIDAVLKADVRCILSKGWSDRLSPASTDNPQNPSSSSSSRPEPVLPPSIHQIRSAPHDWLFTQVDAVVHHGGAGTTGASLRAGVPTVIKPFFGDQFFFATRVADLGVGLHLNRLTANVLGKALWLATHDSRMRDKAARLGRRVRAEDGVGTAIDALYRDLEYARSLIKPLRPVSVAKGAAVGGKGQGQGKGQGREEDEEEGDEEDDDAESEVVLMELRGEEGVGETEETWTFVEAGTSASSTVPAAGKGASGKGEQKRGFVGAMLSRGRLI